MRYTATLVGAGYLADDFEGLLDDVEDGVMVGDASTSVVSLVYTVRARSGARARVAAASAAAAVIGRTADAGVNLVLVVARATRG